MGWNKKKLHVQEEGPRFWGLGWRPELIALVGRGNQVRKRKVAVVVELLRGKNMETLSRRREQPDAAPTKARPAGRAFRRRFLGMDSSPRFIRQPEGNRSLLVFQESCNRRWLIARPGCKTPWQARLGLPAGKIAA